MRIRANVLTLFLPIVAGLAGCASNELSETVQTRIAAHQPLPSVASVDVIPPDAGELKGSGPGVTVHAVIFAQPRVRRLKISDPKPVMAVTDATQAESSGSTGAASASGAPAGTADAANDGVGVLRPKATPDAR